MGSQRQAVVARQGGKPEAFVEAHRDARDEAMWGIGELARELGVTARAIRFYESKGLLTPKRVGTTRIYGRRERARVQLIMRGRQLGIPLRELKKYLELYGERGEGRRKQLEHVIVRCTARLEELEAKREQLDNTIEEIRHIRRESTKKLEALS